MERSTPPDPQPTELEFFEPLVGTRFEITALCRGDGLDQTEPLERPQSTTLIEAQASASTRGREGFRHPFELLFKLEPGSGFPQGELCAEPP